MNESDHKQHNTIHQESESSAQHVQASIPAEQQPHEPTPTTPTHVQENKTTHNPQAVPSQLNQVDAPQPTQVDVTHPSTHMNTPQTTQYIMPHTEPQHTQPQHIQPQQTQPHTQANPNIAQPSGLEQHASKLHITPDSERSVEVAESGFGAKQPTTVIEVFKATATKYKEQYALSVKRDSIWRHWNWGQYYNDAVQFARALIYLKYGSASFTLLLINKDFRFQPSQTVSILGFNSPGRLIFLNL